MLRMSSVEISSLPPALRRTPWSSEEFEGTCFAPGDLVLRVLVVAFVEVSPLPFRESAEIDGQLEDPDGLCKGKHIEDHVPEKVVDVDFASSPRPRAVATGRLAVSMHEVLHGSRRASCSSPGRSSSPLVSITFAHPMPAISCHPSSSTTLASMPCASGELSRCGTRAASPGRASSPAYTSSDSGSFVT